MHGIAPGNVNLKILNDLSRSLTDSPTEHQSLKIYGKSQDFYTVLYISYIKMLQRWA